MNKGLLDCFIILRCYNFSILNLISWFLILEDILISFSKDINKNVFFTSFLFIFVITASGAIWPKALNEFFKVIQGWLITNTSWIYILSVGTILLFTLYLMVSRLGDIKLGPDHSTPDYGNLSWFAMLFSAGMGIGLLFFGVAEPLMHFSSPPVGDGSTIESAREAMKITFFHWGIHAWAIYAILAVILAYFSYRKNLPLLPRSALFSPWPALTFGASCIASQRDSTNACCRWL